MQKHLPTTAKQQRLSYIGALVLNGNGDFHKIFTKNVDTVNEDTVIQFFDEIQTNFSEKITIICDNARYFKSKKINLYISNENCRITLEYLPPYSPNLNPIERLWKIMRENVCYNRCYHKFADFSQKIEEFFTEKIATLETTIKNRINDNFQIIKPNMINLAQ